MGKNNLLSGISKSRNQIDNPHFSKRIVAFGILVSYCLMLVPAKEYLMERDNAAILSERYEIEKETLSEEEKTVIEKALNGEVVCDEVFWGEYESYDGTSQNEVLDSMILIHKSKLYELLLKAKEEFVSEKNNQESDKIQSENEWKKIAEKIVNDYLFENEITEDSDVSELKNDWSDMERKLYGEALSELLYDQYSLKKEADSNAAGIVTDKLISDVENETRSNLDVLFETLKVDSEYDESSFYAEKDEWFESFQKYIEEGIAKWEKVETDFLSAKYEFENETGEKYAEDIEKWAVAYEEFLERKNEWNKEIEQRLTEGIVLWQQKSEKLNLEIDKAMEDYKNELLAEYRQKNEEFAVNCEIYTQTRTLLTTACNEVKEWIGVWADKYDGLYSYWKTEDNEKNEITRLRSIVNVNQENCEEIKGLIQNLKKLYEKTSADLKIKNDLKLNSMYRDYLNKDQILWSELELVENWLEIIAEYSNTLDGCIKNIEKAAFDYSDNTYALSGYETEYKLLENKLEICKKEVEIAKAVYEYSTDNTSKVEIKKITEKNLKNAGELSDAVNQEYQTLAEKSNDLRIKYEAALKDYEDQKEVVADFLQKLQDAKLDYKTVELTVSFTDLDDLKEKFLVNVNSINLINSGVENDSENIIELMNIIENYSYNSIYKNSEKVIEREYSGYDVEYQDENGEIVSYHVKGIAELKKELEENYDKETELMLNTKLETINYLDYGKFDPGNITNVDYDAIIEACKMQSVDVCIENDIKVKNEIKKIIEKFTNNQPENYYEKSDEEIEKFFNEIDVFLNDSEFSDFIYDEIDLYKNQIINARIYKDEYDKCEEFFNQVDEVFGKRINIDECYFDIESYEMFFDCENSIYDDFSDLTYETYQNKVNELYYNLTEKQYLYQDYFEQILSFGERLISVNEIQNDSKDSVEKAKKNLDYINEKYKEEVEKCNGNNSDSLFNKLKQAIEEFNSINEQISEKYQELEKCRHDEDICREVYNWAQNEYLHLEYQFEDMDLPEERYYKALEECEKAQSELDGYKSKIETINLESHFELSNQFGENVLLQYENCSKSYSTVQIFEYELKEAISEQYEKLYRAQQDEDNLVSNIIVQTEETSFELNNLINYFVKISVSEKDGEKYYSISFNDNVISSNNGIYNYASYESFYNACKSYVTEKDVCQYDCNGNEIWYSQSAVDALGFMQSLSEKPYSIDDLLLALCYIKLNSGNENLFFDGENPKENKNYQLASIQENIQGIHVFDEYQNGRMNAVKKAYDLVVNENGLDDIAKLIFYSSYNLSENYDLENREIDLIAVYGMNSLNLELTKKIYENQVIALSLTLAAAVTALAALAPFCKWLFAVAAAMQIASVTYGVLAYDVSCVKDDVKSIQNGYQKLYDDIIYDTDNVVSRWINAQKKVEIETAAINNLLYGSDKNTEELNYTLFEKQLKNIFNKDKGCSIDFEYLENLCLADEEINSLEDLYNIAVNEKECKTTLDAAECISEYVKNKYSEASELVSQTADVARTDENWNEVLFQREIGNIAFDNFINGIPVKISREQENYISDGFENIKTSYENILSEYYSNLLIQKENELELKRNYFNDQYEDWINCIKNVKIAADQEWNKAENEFNEKFKEWNDDWLSSYNEIENEYEAEYSALLDEKTEWINKKYIEQSLGISIGTIDEESFDSEIENIKIIANEIVDSNKGFLLNNNDSYLSNSLQDLKAFDNISSCINSLNNEVLNYSISLFNAEKIKLFDYEKNELIENTVNSLDEQINTSALMISVQTAAKELDERIDELYNQIEQSNKNFEKWEKELVLKDGYSYGNEITRDAIVHSVVFGGNIRSKQTVHKYEYFTCAGPEISFSYQKGDSYDYFSSMIENNYYSLNRWYEQIFGSDQKKGLFAEHIGTEPVFIENVNTEKNRVENISNPGSGQLGFVMLDFIWNAAVNRVGYQEIATAMYDRKLTVDNEICGVELPTVRDITSIAFDIVANCTGQKWISVIDDVAFGVMDLTLEQKTADQVFLGLAASAASIGISSAASSAINSVTNSAMNEISKVALTSGINAAQSYTTAVTSSYINAISFSDGFNIDWDKANSVWTDENVLKNSISAGATTLINGSLNNLTLTDGTGRVLNDSYYNISAVRSLNSTLSNVAVAGAEILLSGATTVNLLSAGGTGLLAMTISDDGVSAKISSEGHNLNVADAVSGISGIGDAAWVLGAKMSAALGNDNNVALLNGINCLSYYSAERAGELAEEIWSGNKIVNVKNMDALGRTLGNVIEVSDKIAGNNDESAVQIASILLHEDAHSQGLDEFQARIVGYDLYSNMSGVYDTSKKIYENVSDVSFFTEAYKQFGEEGLYMMMQLTDAFSHHNDGWDYYLAETIDSGIKQNLSDNNFIALGNSLVKKKIDEYNNAHIEESYEKYMKDGYQEYVKTQILLGKVNENDYLSYEDFCTSGLLKYGDKSVFAKAILERNKELSAYQFAVKDLISIGDYGCVLSTATYITYSLTGKLYSLSEANEICKSAGVYNGAYINWGENYKDAVNALAGEEALTEFGRASKLVEKNHLLNDITSSDDAYFVVARVLDDSHATLLKSEQNDYTYKGSEKSYNSLDVLNSWYSTNPNSKLGASNYKMSEVSNLTWYKVNDEYLNKYKNLTQYRETKMKEIKQKYAY